MAWLPHCVTPSLEPHIRPHDINTTNLQRRPVMHPRWLVSVLHHGRACTGTRISTGYPSTTPVGLALGPDSPWEDELDPGTLSHPADRILTYQFVTHACILTPTQSTRSSLQASPRAGRSPTQQHTSTPVPGASITCCCHSFGGTLEPRYIVGAEPLDQ